MHNRAMLELHTFCAAVPLLFAAVCRGGECTANTDCSLTLDLCEMLVLEHLP